MFANSGPPKRDCPADVTSLLIAAVCEFSRFYDSFPVICNKTRIPHFYNPFPAVNCTHMWSHQLLGPRWDRGRQTQESRKLVFIPLSPGTHSLAPTGKDVQPVSGAVGPWPRPSLDQDPNTLELRAYRKEPNPLTLAFPTPSLGPSHCLPALACALPAL